MYHNGRKWTIGSLTVVASAVGTKCMNFHFFEAERDTVTPLEIRRQGKDRKIVAICIVHGFIIILFYKLADPEP